MTPQSNSRRLGVKALGLAAAVTQVAAGPCDIYASGNTPCVAAHGTTRALYGAYDGPLYQVQRDSDGTTTDVAPLSAGGTANAGTQDSFCAGTTCQITVIYDQSGRGNHLKRAPPGGFNGPQPDGSDDLASAVGAPVTLNGQKAYGVFIPPGAGYSNNAPNGTATGDEPEGMYAVIDGTHYNDQCCFDYGNAEINSHDTGNGHMEAIYFGTNTAWGSGAGNGPWIMNDLENGLFSGENPKNNPADPTVTDRFLTAIIKGEPNRWAIRGASATSGSLNTYYSGPRPDADGYNPMSKEGAIILGIGGDNSPNAQGTFYEGVITSGYPSDETENSVQADIAAAKYATAPMTSGPALTTGKSVSLRAITSCCTTRYLTADGSKINTQEVSSGSDDALKRAASWTVRAGLANDECVSFESVDAPGNFIRHSDFVLGTARDDGSKQMREDATWCSQEGFTGGDETNSIRSWNYPLRYLRHYANAGYAASNGGVHQFDAAGSFGDDATWMVSAGFA